MFLSKGDYQVVNYANASKAQMKPLRLGTTRPSVEWQKPTQVWRLLYDMVDVCRGLQKESMIKSRDDEWRQLFFRVYKIKGRIGIVSLVRKKESYGEYFWLRTFSEEDLRESAGWEERPNGKGECDNLKEWEINTPKQNQKHKRDFF